MREFVDYLSGYCLLERSLLSAIMYMLAQEVSIAVSCISAYLPLITDLRLQVVWIVVDRMLKHYKT
jgi:hypothetical protein